MLSLLFQGAVLGLVLSFMIGPLFFALVETVLEYGRRAAWALSLGILASDMGFVLVVMSGMAWLSALMANPMAQAWAGRVGSFMLIGFGGSILWTVYRNKNTRKSDYISDAYSSKPWWTFAIKGFALNTINPGTLVFWLGIGTGVVAQNGWNDTEVGLFFGAMLSVLAITDILKIYLGHRLSRWLTPQHINQVRLVIGSVLLGYGVFLIVK
jgi:threonine/homoserine/homoserine lactone efflux protein